MTKEQALTALDNLKTKVAAAFDLGYPVKIGFKCDTEPVCSVSAFGAPVDFLYEGETITIRIGRPASRHAQKTAIDAEAVASGASPMFKTLVGKLTSTHEFVPSSFPVGRSTERTMIGHNEDVVRDAIRLLERCAGRLDKGNVDLILRANETAKLLRDQFEEVLTGRKKLVEIPESQWRGEPSAAGRAIVQDLLNRGIHSSNPYLYQCAQAVKNGEALEVAMHRTMLTLAEHNEKMHEALMAKITTSPMTFDDLKPPPVPDSGRFKVEPKVIEMAGTLTQVGGFVPNLTPPPAPKSDELSKSTRTIPGQLEYADHGPDMLFIIDEASAIDPKVCDAVDKVIIDLCLSDQPEADTPHVANAGESPAK